MSLYYWYICELITELGEYVLRNKFELRLNNVLGAVVIGMMIAGNALVYSGPSYASGGGGEEDPIPIKKQDCVELKHSKKELEKTIRFNKKRLVENNAEAKRHSEDMAYTNNQISKAKTAMKAEKDKEAKKVLRKSLKGLRYHKNNSYQHARIHRGYADSNESVMNDALNRLNVVKKQLAGC